MTGLNMMPNIHKKIAGQATSVSDDVLSEDIIVFIDALNTVIFFSEIADLKSLLYPRNDIVIDQTTAARYLKATNFNNSLGPDGILWKNTSVLC